MDTYLRSQLAMLALQHAMAVALAQPSVKPPLKGGVHNFFKARMFHPHLWEHVRN
jgi:hypothetical protein